jgi:hypothetical protein
MLQLNCKFKFMQKNNFLSYEGDDYLKRTKKLVLSRLENNLFSDMDVLVPLLKKKFKNIRNRMFFWR